MCDHSGKLNDQITSKEAEKICGRYESDQKRLDNVMHVPGVSARGYYKVLKVARTIQDCQGRPTSWHFT